MVLGSPLKLTHYLPEDLADMVERLGYERLQLPRGVKSVQALDFGTAMLLAESNPQATRALHLVALMLKGDDEIDWTAGCAALEIVEHDLQTRGVDGKPSGLTEARMTTGAVMWFINGVVADWLSYLGKQDQTDPGAGGGITGPSDSRVV